MGKRGRATLNGITFQHREWTRFLEGAEVGAVVSQQANAIASRAGSGFNASTYLGDFGGGRVIGSVWADTAEANEREATEKALTKAVG